MHFGDFLTIFAFQKYRDWILTDDHTVKILLSLINFGFCSSKYSISLPLCWLEFTKGDFAPLMRTEGHPVLAEGFEIFPCFLLPIRDNYVFDDEAMFDLYCWNPRKCLCTFMVPRWCMPGVVRLCECILLLILVIVDSYFNDISLLSILILYA